MTRLVGSKLGLGSPELELTRTRVITVRLTYLPIELGYIILLIQLPFYVRTDVVNFYFFRIELTNCNAENNKEQVHKI